MKKLFALMALTLSVAGTAHAHDSSGYPTVGAPVDTQAYSCRVAGDIAGASVGLVFGGQYISGPGMITCSTNTGYTRSLPVYIRIVGGGAAIDLTVFRNIRLYSSGVAVVGGPEAMLRSFSIGATAGATLISEGVSFDAALRASGSGLGFDVGLQGQDVIGLGYRLYGTVLSIEAR